MSKEPTPLQLQEFAQSPLSQIYLDGYLDGYKASCDAHRRIVGRMLETLQAVLDNYQEDEVLKKLLRPEAKLLQRILDESASMEQMVTATHAMMVMGGQKNG